MERTKRQRENTIDDNNKKKKFATSSDNVSRKYVTHLEDLANELIYEIFEYLDFYDIYGSFMDLNIRFNYLINYSNLPININLSLKSKTNFEHYYKNIHTCYKNRIKSIYFSNPLIIEHVLSSSSDSLLSLKRLEKVTLHNIISIQLQQILSCLKNSSTLFSLDIICIDIINDKSNLYQQIFLLSYLKSCKLSFEEYDSHGLISVATNEYSPLEYLTIKHDLELHEINSLLSYVPQLRRLSFECEYQPVDIESFSSSIVLNNLTHLQLRIDGFGFDKLESIMKNVLHRIQVLHLSIASKNDNTYFDADRWRQFILTYLPYLKNFHVQIAICNDRNFGDNYDQYLNQIEEFNSLFWKERRWFFQYGFQSDKDTTDHVLYSINPYRSKSVMLSGSTDEQINIKGEKFRIDSADYVVILDKIELNNCKFYFPNATTLDIPYQYFYKKYDSSFSVNVIFDSTKLNRIISLEKLTNLDINLSNSRLSNIIDILYHTPNTDTLSITYVQQFNYHSSLFEQNQMFQSVYERNKIKELTIVSNQILDTTKFLITLCPRLKQLILYPRLKRCIPTRFSFPLRNSGMKQDEDFIMPLLQFLLSKDNINTRYLSSFIIRSDEINSVKTFLEMEKLHDVSSIKIQKPKNSLIYLWW